MTGYKLVNLRLMIDALGEQRTKELLSKFSCPLNQDVETFLRAKAIEFSRQGIAQTHLVYASFKNSPVLAGYFSLANKYMTIKADVVGGKLKQRLKRFSTYNSDIKAYCLSAPLIAQLGKNYYNGADRLISGAELLDLACQKISTIQFDLGGKFAYLECEDKHKLVEFYSLYGFCEFDRRILDKDETGLSGEYLIQMLKFID